MKEDDIVVLDRNCHKSIEQGLMLTGARPVYMVRPATATASSDRSRPPRSSPQSIHAKAKAGYPPAKTPDKKPVYAVLTNSTYDGLCYNAVGSQRALAKSATGSISTKRGTATRASIRCTGTTSPCAAIPATIPGAPTVFATHSTHKLLAALSQASYIHVRDGKGAIDHGRFNQAYSCRHRTSPLYAIIASNDITSAMMDGKSGHSLTQESIEEAVDFRQVAALVAPFAEKKDWFFKPWNAPEIKAQGGKKVPFTRRSAEAAFHRAGFLGAPPRRQMARLRRHRRRLVHARPDQGEPPLPGHGGRRKARGDRRPGRHGQRLVQPLRHRADAGDRLPGDVPVLDGHQQGQVGHASHQPPRLQAGLRPQCPARKSCRGSPPRAAIATPAWASTISATSCSNICAPARRATERRRPTPAAKADMTPRQAYERLVTGEIEMVPPSSSRTVSPAKASCPTRRASRC